MGYVNTVAHHTAYAARSAGDPIWFRRQNLTPDTIIRRQRDLGVFEFATAIPAIISAVAAAGTATYGIIQSRKDAQSAKKDADKQAAAAAAAEAQAAADTKAANDQRMALLKQQTDADVAATATRTEVVNKFIPVAVVGVLALGGLFIVMRMRRNSKKRK